MISACLISQARRRTIATPVWSLLASDKSGSTYVDLIHDPAQVGTAITYTATCNTGFTAGYGASYLSNGDVGPGNAATTYTVLGAITGNILSLNFGSPKNLGNVSIYCGYDNREGGTYSIRDWSGNVLFGFSRTSSGVGTLPGMKLWYNSGPAPTVTQGIRIYVDSGAAAQSFREIQIFERL